MICSGAGSAVDEVRKGDFQVRPSKANRIGILCDSFTEIRDFDLLRILRGRP